MQLRYISNPHLIAEAGGDPWAINESLQAGRPAQISNLAQAFHDAGRCTAESSTAFDEARRRFEASWNRVNGEHPINDLAEVQRAIQSLGAQSLQLPKIGVDLETIAAALARAQRTGAGLIATLESRLQQFDNQLGQALDLETDTEFTVADRSALDALIRALEQQAIDDTKWTLNQLHSVRSGYSDCLRRSLTILRTDGYDPSVVQTVDAADPPANPEEPLQIPPPGTTAGEINRWWKTLGSQQQSRLTADHPPELGNLNGIPVVVRSRVNKAVMNDDLRRVEDVANQYGVFLNDVLGDPVKYGLTARAIARYNSARRIQEGLIAAGGTVDQDILLLKYQPEAFGGQGAAAITMGNPDTAANTAVLVTGAGTGVPAGTLVKSEAARLYQESAHADLGKQTAVVLWVGYDAPNNWYDPGLRGPDMARIGAEVLAADVNALAVTREGASTHMTVVGHSYGSTVVSDAAAAYGMHANDVVLVGSPGTDLAHSAADFHLSPGGHLYVGAASGDAVTWSPGRVTGPGLIGVSFGGLGDDPSVDGYGSTRFKAEVPGNSINPVYDHLHYFDDGSESLFSISDVVSGHGDALQRDGMTAFHRGEYGLGGWVDPEVVRTATTGHRHRAPTG
jgi:pimeloyl-ACP methyl ester carboxylesterase